VALPPQVVSAAAAALAAELASSAGSAAALAFYRIPPFLLPMLPGRRGPVRRCRGRSSQRSTKSRPITAATCWCRVLARGWMQFEPGTWLHVRGGRAERRLCRPLQPVDAIFAAGVICKPPEPRHLRRAIFAYNHSDAYASSVLLRAKLILRLSAVSDRHAHGTDRRWPPIVGKRLRVADAGSGRLIIERNCPRDVGSYHEGGQFPRDPPRRAPPRLCRRRPLRPSRRRRGRAPQLVDLMSTRDAGWSPCRTVGSFSLERPARSARVHSSARRPR